jgi:hypothetical protein
MTLDPPTYLKDKSPLSGRCINSIKEYISPHRSRKYNVKYIKYIKKASNLLMLQQFQPIPVAGIDMPH